MNCGLVLDPVWYDFNPIKIMNKRKAEKEYSNSWSHPLDPNLEYGHIYPKRIFNPELRRALQLQRKTEKKTDGDAYLKSFLSLKKYCSILNLPEQVKYEAINIYKCIIERDKDFFKKYGTKPSYLSFIKIACILHEFPLKNSQIIELVDYKVNEKRTTAYMDKKFNRAYISAKRLLGNIFKIPEKPRYIDYVCLTLDLPYECAVKVHKIYQKIKKRLRKEHKLEGYILALFYIMFKQDYGITLNRLEELFEVSRITISDRRKFLLKMVKK